VIQALSPHTANEPFTDCVGFGCPNRYPEDIYQRAGSHLVECCPVVGAKKSVRA
jgi:hypothetical protein